MSRPLALIAVLSLAAPVAADDKNWTGKTIKLKEGVKLGSKLGGGLVRDGAALEKGKTFVVKSDDGSYLELVGQAGVIFRSEAEVVAGREMPKRGDPVAKGDDKNLWAVGTSVLPKRTGDIQFGDRDAEGKPVYFELKSPHADVRKDNGDGWVRVHDGYREGWVSKDDFVTMEDAPIYFDKAVKANPKDTWALQMRGIGWNGKGEFDNAIKDFTEVIRLRPDGASAYISRGRAWSAKKDYDKAIVDYTEAIRLDPMRSATFNNRGSVWDNKKEYDKAIQDFTEAIRLDPRNVIARHNRGISWNNMKEYDKAIADLTEAIRLDPKRTQAYVERAVAWWGKKDYDKVIADYTEAVRLDPKQVSVYLKRASVWWEKKEYDKAIADYDKVLELDPRSALAYLNRGLMRWNKKEHDQAVADFDKALELNPKYVTALEFRGSVRRDTKEYEKSLADYDRALEIEPKNAGVIGNKALTLAKQKQYDEALKGLGAATALEPADWVYKSSAWILATCPDEKYRDGKKAVELAKKAIEKAGEGADGFYFDALAAAYAEAGDFELAVAEQRKALEDQSVGADDRKRMEARLELYRAKKPYRDDG